MESKPFSSASFFVGDKLVGEVKAITFVRHLTLDGHTYIIRYDMSPASRMLAVLEMERIIRLGATLAA